MTRTTDDDRTRLEAAHWLPTLGPFGCFGRRWWIRTTDTGLAELLEDLYGDLLAPHDAEVVADATFSVLAPTDDDGGLVYRDRTRLRADRSPHSVLSALVWGINRWVLDEASRDRLLLHAGGVVREDGRAVVLPAPSQSGKSTLTTGLLDRGYGYLSDEAVSVTADRQLEGYPKPLSLDPGAWEALSHHEPQLPAAHARYLDRQWHVRASSFTAVPSDAQMGAVVFPRYDHDAVDTTIERVSPSTAVMTAGASTFAPGNAARIEAWQVRTLAAALSGIPCYRLVTTELPRALDLVEDVLRQL